MKSKELIEKLKKYEDLDVEVSKYIDYLFSLEEENKALKRTVHFMNEQTRLQEEKIKDLENTLEFLRIQVENNFSDKYIKEKYNEVDLQKLWESAKTIMKWKAGK